MSDCTQYLSLITVTKSVFDPALPGNLTPSDPTVEFPAFETWHCAQVVQGTEVVKDFEMSFFTIVINNPNRAENSFHAHVYVFQAYSNSQGFVENALARYGLNVTKIPTISMSRVQATGSPVGALSYELPTDPPDYKPRGTYQDPAPGRIKEADAYYYMTANGLARFGISYAGRISSGYEGEIEFGPKSYWAQHSSAGQMATSFNYNPELTADLGFSRIW